MCRCTTGPHRVRVDNVSFSFACSSLPAPISFLVSASFTPFVNDAATAATNDRLVARSKLKRVQADSAFSLPRGLTTSRRRCYIYIYIYTIVYHQGFHASHSFISPSLCLTRTHARHPLHLFSLVRRVWDDLSASLSSFSSSASLALLPLRVYLYSAIRPTR